MTDVETAEITEEKTDSGADEQVQVHEAELNEAADQPTAAPIGQLDILLDTTMPVSAELGQADVEVRQLLQLAPGSVLQLDKQIGEPIELFLHGVRFATGQLVVVGDRLGVRVKEILSPKPPQTNNGDEN